MEIRKCWRTNQSQQDTALSKDPFQSRKSTNEVAPVASKLWKAFVRLGTWGTRDELFPSS